ncbi:GNAT family N-acetyltransferase [Nitratireductor pacificus]|uniref:L-ornithine N(alpha)-acyltransferase n=1 Tax=Nitratireductor pacificus pht-3B TaxID=391937 RepID=K2LQP4_9HYPH|nr:GNAT family N-acetyltransferase [Nitratireductor pacificus]EKF20074.1 ornithine-acyl[acyl carrier protein] N-acyltransferase [Nitratireductor pacificus pht-3B]
MQGMALNGTAFLEDVGQPPLSGNPGEIAEDGLLGRIGPLQVRLARDEREIAAAQTIRFRVFYDEMGARPSGEAALQDRDSDGFDSVCDHLLVIDSTLPGDDMDRIVGTYRLLTPEGAGRMGRFYSQDEFAIEGLMARHAGRRFLELGRSCVLPPYRTKRTIELLWQGIWAYCRRMRIDVMMGCASFPGIVPAAHAEALSFLGHFCQAEGDWHVRAVASRFAPMDLMPKEAVQARSALTAMPPLVKGYLRLGARFGEGCVIDHDFGTTDVFVVLPVEAISDRYINYYGADAQRFAA